MAEGRALTVGPPPPTPATARASSSRRSHTTPIRSVRSTISVAERSRKGESTSWVSCEEGLAPAQATSSNSSQRNALGRLVGWTSRRRRIVTGNEHQFLWRMSTHQGHGRGDRECVVDGRREQSMRSTSVSAQASSSSSSQRYTPLGRLVRRTSRRRQHQQRSCSNM